MQRISKTRTIGGLEVTTTQFAGPRALRLAPRVGKILVPLLHLRGKMKGATEASELTAAIEGLFAQLDETTIDWLCEEILKSTSIVMPNDAGQMQVVELGTAAMRDFAFGGEDGMGLLVQVILFVAEVNWARYFFALARSMKAKTTANASTSPTTSDPSTPASGS